MFSALHGFLEREKMGMFSVNTALASGLAVDIDSSNHASLNAATYGSIYGSVIAASCTTAANNLRELGWLEQPVNSTGPQLLEIMSNVYDENQKQGQTAAVVMSKAGALIATDQYVSGAGTGAIKFDGTVLPGAICGIASGQPRVLQTGDQPRLKFLGQVTQRKLACAAFLIM